VNIGISYRTAPAATLERLAVVPGEQHTVLGQLRALSGVDEVFALSTCNRVEVYAATAGPPGEAALSVAALLADRAGMPADVVRQLARIRIDAAAVEHLFSVTSGLDSMAVGEEQIVAQVKAAQRDAAVSGTTGPVLTGLLEAALRASKRARTKTMIGTAGVSLARAGLDLARAHLGDLAGRRAVVAGTGSMGRLAARLLYDSGAHLSIVSRSAARAGELAATMGGRPVPVDELAAAIAAADVLVTAMGSPTPIVRRDDVRAPLFMLDLGRPADVEPAAGLLPGVVLVDLAALGRHLARADVPDDVPRAQAIVAEEVGAYLTRQEQAAAAPVIAALHAQIRQLADAELCRLHDRLPGLDDAQRSETAATVHRILRKVLHRPTVRAKELTGGPDGPVYVEALRQLFDLPAAVPSPTPRS
jgi:glutamyl-tRNA reductase